MPRVQPRQNLDWSDLDARLKPIVEAELARGNAVSEVTVDAFPTCPLFVFMKRQFGRRYDDVSPTVVYDEINDPHWWKAEYRVKVTPAADDARAMFHTVACPFRND